MKENGQEEIYDEDFLEKIVYGEENADMGNMENFNTFSGNDVDDENNEEDIENNYNKNNNVYEEEVEEDSNDILSKTLPMTFGLLNKMTDEAYKSSENIEKMYKTTENIKDIISSLKENVEKLGELGEIVNHLNLVKNALTLNNNQLMDLINALAKVSKKQDSLENDIEEIKYDATDAQDTPKSEVVQKNNDYILYVAVGMNLLLTLFVGVKIGF